MSHSVTLEHRSDVEIGSLTDTAAYTLSSMPSMPPERIELDGVVIRRESEFDAEAVAKAIAENLERLSEWMEWAVPDAGTAGTQRARIADTVVQWNSGSVYDYVLTDTSDGVLGKAGLRRTGSGAVEIGYWLTTDAEGHGVITRTVSALTDIALTLDGIGRVEIHCDSANPRSFAVPRRLGYRLDHVIDHPITSPGQTGRQMIWIDDAK